MEDLKDDELVAFGDTQNSLINGPKLLLLSMVVLAIQDLNLEKHFKGLKRYFIVSKKEKREVENIISALEYIFDKDGDYEFSFENFCYVFKIQPDLLRKLILKFIRMDRGIAWTEYLIWSDRNAV
jgi:hypothetical protein